MLLSVQEPGAVAVTGTPDHHLDHWQSLETSKLMTGLKNQLPWPEILRLPVKPAHIKLKLMLAASSKAYTGPSECLWFSFYSFSVGASGAKLLHPQ